jgi:hypothetical protein
LVTFEFESGTVRLFYIYLCPFGESHLLVSWCAGGWCSMACSGENRGRSRRPDVKDSGWSHRSGTRWPSDQEDRWHCVWSAPCTWRRGVQVSLLSLKIKVDGLSVVWSQNHWDGFLCFGLKTNGDDFSRFDLKTGGGFLC